MDYLLWVCSLVVPVVLAVEAGFFCDDIPVFVMRLLGHAPVAIVLGVTPASGVRVPHLPRLSCPRLRRFGFPPRRQRRRASLRHCRKDPDDVLRRFERPALTCVWAP
ncbi:hypothetical protein ILYODFUR_013636 [Ilyodon furcidens]|uniref:Uncharacterized protein n=1 Tax=Ilyodon furcidens TaxID=33524 RepID=A0ABV0SX14_9TELE